MRRLDARLALEITMLLCARLARYATRQRLRYGFYTALVLAGLLPIVQQREQIDLQVCYTTGLRLLAGEPLYRLSGNAMPFKYAPPVALLWGLLSFVSKALVGVVWNSLQALGLGYFFMAMWCYLRRLLPVPGWVVVVSALLCSELIQHMFGLGQLDGGILALLAVFIAYVQRRPWLVAWALALVILVKLPYGLVLLWALYERHFTYLWRLPCCLAVLTATAFPVFGVTGTLAQFAAWQDILASTTVPLLCFRANQSLWAMLCTATRLPPAHLWRLALPLSVLFVGVGVWTSQVIRQHAQTENERALAGAVLLCWLLYGAAVLSQLGWRTNLLSMVPLVMLALALAPTTTIRSARLLVYGGVAVLGGAFFGLGHTVVGGTRFHLLMQYRSLGFGALAGMTLLLLGITWGRPRQAPTAQPG